MDACQAKDEVPGTCLDREVLLLRDAGLEPPAERPCASRRRGRGIPPRKADATRKDTAAGARSVCKDHSPLPHRGLPANPIQTSADLRSSPAQIPDDSVSGRGPHFASPEPLADAGAPAFEQSRKFGHGPGEGILWAKEPVFPGKSSSDVVPWERSKPGTLQIVQRWIGRPGGEPGILHRPADREMVKTLESP